MRAAAQPRTERINTRGSFVRFWLIVLPLTLILAACGGGPAATVVVRGTSTPTPPPTPLPQVATALPAGFPDNPLRIMMIPQDLEQAEALKLQLENAILQSTSVTVEIVFATDRLQLLDALCDTSSDSLTAIWADALTYSVADAQRCGDAAVWLTRDGTNGETRQIVLSGDLQSRDVRSLQRNTFCRIRRDDFDSWLLPVLLLESNGVDVSTLEDVREYPDTTSLLNAVALGECSGTGVLTSTLVTWQASNPSAAENLVGVVESVPIPYGVLMYPYQIPVAARLALTNELPNLAAVMLPTPTPTLTETPDALRTEEADLTTTATSDAVSTQEAISTSEATSEATANAESTQEVAFDSTAEATTDATAEATSESTATVNIDAAEAAAETTAAVTTEIEAAFTAEATQDSTAEPISVPIIAAEDTATLLAPFVGPGTLVALDADDLLTLDTFLADSGLNFSQLGQ